MLYGNICTISNIVKKIKNVGKYAFVYVDLLGGVSNGEVAIRFLKPVTGANSITSIEASMLKVTRAEGFFCIHRLSIVDSISLHNIDKQVAQSNSDCVETLPGCVPKVLGWVTEKTRKPLIIGGLVYDEEDARNAINAGIVALSITDTRVWTLARKLL